MNFTPMLTAEFQETQPAVAIPECACDQGRKPPCICAETLAARESPPAALWRKVCRFFATPEFDAQMARLADREWQA